MEKKENALCFVCTHKCCCLRSSVIQTQISLSQMSFKNEILRLYQSSLGWSSMPSANSRDLWGGSYDVRLSSVGQVYVYQWFMLKRWGQLTAWMCWMTRFCLPWWCRHLPRWQWQHEASFSHMDWSQQSPDPIFEMCWRTFYAAIWPHSRSIHSHGEKWRPIWREISVTMHKLIKNDASAIACQHQSFLLGD